MWKRYLYEETLKNDGSICIRYKDIKTITVEMVKIINGMSPGHLGF